MVVPTAIRVMAIFFFIKADRHIGSRIPRPFMDAALIAVFIAIDEIIVLMGMGVQAAEFKCDLSIFCQRMRQVDIPEMPGRQIPSQQHLQNWPGIIAGRSPINLLVFGNVLRDRNCATP